jgi:quercetin dioxygenase-like cupin family protein
MRQFHRRSEIARTTEWGENPMENSDKIERKTLLTAFMESVKTVDHVEIKAIELAPSQRTGLHRHPCIVVGYVVDGAIVFQIEEQKNKTLRAGDAFYEPENARILRFDNASETNPAKFIAFYLLGPGDNRLIEMLE